MDISKIYIIRGIFVKNKKKKFNIIKKIDFKKGISKSKELFFEKLNLPDEITYNLAKITMLENTQLYIEGKNKIVDYYDNYIKIRLENIFVIIMGRNLEIQDISDLDVLIVGKITNIEYSMR